MLDLALVVGQRAVGNDLESGQRAAVVDVQKRKSPFAVAARANPTLHDGLLPNGRRLASILDADLLHVPAPSRNRRLRCIAPRARHRIAPAAESFTPAPPYSCRLLPMKQPSSPASTPTPAAG